MGHICLFCSKVLGKFLQMPINQDKVFFKISPDFDIAIVNSRCCRVINTFFFFQKDLEPVYLIFSSGGLVEINN